MSTEALRVAGSNFMTMAQQVSNGDTVLAEDLLKVIAILQDGMPAEVSPFPDYQDDHLKILVNQFRMALRSDDERAARNLRALMTGRPVNAILFERAHGGPLACRVTISDPAGITDQATQEAATPARAMVAATLAFAAQDCAAALRLAHAREEREEPLFDGP